MATPPQNRPNQAKIAAEEIKAYNLAIKGYSTREIAKLLVSDDKPDGVCISTAHRRIHGALDRIPDADVASARRLALHQYEHMIAKLRRAHNNQKLSTKEFIQEWRSCLKEVCRLLGLNAPTTIALTHQDGEISFDPNGDLARIIDEAKRLNLQEQGELDDDR